MAKQDNDFPKKLLATFKIEAHERVMAMSSGLLALEKAPAAVRQMEIIERILREAHSLKGAARAVNLTEIEAVCQPLESVFAALKRKDIIPSPGLLDTLHQAVDELDRLLSSFETKSTTAERSRLAVIIELLESAVKVDQPPSKRGAAKEAEAATVLEQIVQAPTLPLDRQTAEAQPLVTETVRIPAARLDSLLLQAEELLSAKLAAGQRVAELHEIRSVLTACNKEWSRIHPALCTLEQSVEASGPPNRGRTARSLKVTQMSNLLESVERNSTAVKSLESKVTTLTRLAERDHRSLGGMVDNLLLDMKQVSMLPFSSLLEIFPKFVRELARDQGKEADLAVVGAEIEVDRRILEEMKDPLIHLMRNCIDHGIEKPEERAPKGKPPRATVTIAIAQKSGNRIEMLIADDGAGIDVAQVRAAALKLGVVSPDTMAQMNDKEALSLIYLSGISTSPILTDISGRGLGLAIVKEKVEKLGGTVSVETRPDAGTTFRIALPLTLATFRGFLVKVDEHLFILPTTQVERVVRVRKAEIKTVENRETICVNGETVSLVALGDALELPRKSVIIDSEESLPVLILSSAGKRIAFLVDEILREQEVLVKTLGKQLSRVRNIAGATALGAGKVVPILNVADLVKSAVRVASAPARAAVTGEVAAVKRKSVLIAEDSITARTLLKNIVEAAGYHVKTAVDGVEAFTALKTEDFDLLVSDIDMPRMNGFDLTAKIRNDKKLAPLPVVLVTALESHEDRERGIDVGANAYIVKSSFDQSNLLEVIRRFL